MTEISSVSQTDLAERRRQLRRQRRSRFLQNSWQAVAICGLTAGVVWAISLPDWMLREPGQIVIQGNESLSADMIRAQLRIPYPQSILMLQPQKIAQQLEAEAPIAEATVSRRLFPPGLVVNIRERYPVAVAYSNPSLDKNRATLSAVALLDEKGTWIPYETYATLNQSRKLPTLKVIGMQENFRSQWVPLYQAVIHSPVKITEIDWREPGNLVLHTDLGIVHFGPYGDRFSEQLQTLDQMRQLHKTVSADQIAYIDLRNPDTPMIELVSDRLDPPDSEEN